MGPGAALHVVAGLQTEAADLGDGEVDVLGAGIVVGHAEEPVPVGQHLQHALHGGTVLRFQHLGHGGVGGAVLLVVVGLLLLARGGGRLRRSGPRLLVLAVGALIAAIAVVVVAEMAGVALLVAAVLPVVVPAMLIRLLPRLFPGLRLLRLLGRLLRLLLRGGGHLRLLRRSFRLLLPVVPSPAGGFGRLLSGLGLALRYLSLLFGGHGLRLLCLGGAAPLLGGRRLALGQHLNELVFPIFAYVFHAQSLRHRAQLCQVLFLQILRSHSLPPMVFSIV